MEIDNSGAELEPPLISRSELIIDAETVEKYRPEFNFPFKNVRSLVIKENALLLPRVVKRLIFRNRNSLAAISISTVTVVPRRLQNYDEKRASESKVVSPPPGIPEGCKYSHKTATSTTLEDIHNICDSESVLDNPKYFEPRSWGPDTSDMERIELPILRSVEIVGDFCSAWAHWIHANLLTPHISYCYIQPWVSHPLSRWIMVGLNANESTVSSPSGSPMSNTNTADGRMSADSSASLFEVEGVPRGTCATCHALTCIHNCLMYTFGHSLTVLHFPPVPEFLPLAGSEVIADPAEIDFFQQLLALILTSPPHEEDLLTRAERRLSEVNDMKATRRISFAHQTGFPLLSELGFSGGGTFTLSMHAIRQVLLDIETSLCLHSTDQQNIDAVGKIHQNRFPPLSYIRGVWDLRLGHGAFVSAKLSFPCDLTVRLEPRHLLSRYKNLPFFGGTDIPWDSCGVDAASSSSSSADSPDEQIYSADDIALHDEYVDLDDTSNTNNDLQMKEFIDTLSAVRVSAEGEPSARKLQARGVWARCDLQDVNAVLALFADDIRELYVNFGKTKGHFPPLRLSLPQLGRLTLVNWSYHNKHIRGFFRVAKFGENRAAFLKMFTDRNLLNTIILKNEKQYFRAVAHLMRILRSNNLSLAFASLCPGPTDGHVKSFLRTFLSTVQRLQIDTIHVPETMRRTATQMKVHSNKTGGTPDGVRIWSLRFRDFPGGPYQATANDEIQLDSQIHSPRLMPDIGNYRQMPEVDAPKLLINSKACWVRPPIEDLGDIDIQLQAMDKARKMEESTIGAHRKFSDYSWVPGSIGSELLTILCHNDEVRQTIESFSTVPYPEALYLAPIETIKAEIVYRKRLVKEMVKSQITTLVSRDISSMFEASLKVFPKLLELILFIRNVPGSAVLPEIPESEPFFGGVVERYAAREFRGFDLESATTLVELERRKSLLLGRSESLNLQRKRRLSQLGLAGYSNHEMDDHTDGNTECESKRSRSFTDRPRLNSSTPTSASSFDLQFSRQGGNLRSSHLKGTIIIWRSLNRKGTY